MINAFLKRLIPLALVAALIPACGGLVPFVDAHTWLKAVMRNTQEVPASASAQTGLGIFGVAGQQTAIDYSVTHSVAVVASVDIHLGAPGTNGPILFTLTPAASPMTGTLTSTDLTPSPADGIHNFVDACAAMLAGNTYVDIKTAGMPDGEIRGQIGGSLVKARSLTGKHVNPPVTTTSTASATFQINLKDTTSTTIPADIEATIDVKITSTGLNTTDVTGVFIHVGNPSTVSALSNIIFTLFSTGTYTNPFSVTLTLAHFTSQAGAATLDEAVNAILSGQTYLEIETGTNPGGEIRSQIGAVQFTTGGFTGSQEAPPIVSAGTASGEVVLSGAQDTLTYRLDYTVITPTSADIRVAPAGLNGPQLFILSAATFASPLKGVLVEADIEPGSGLTTLDEVIEALLTSKTYFQLPTAGNPTGELRGQLSP